MIRMIPRTYTRAIASISEPETFAVSIAADTGCVMAEVLTVDDKYCTLVL